ncbi:MAG: hypothetical protein LKF75_03525 [Bacilli bacterium]|jgi:predicted ABC-type ATPase|nr:hypothetical protein [Bacilli bacterium]MCH4228752.1 hypothetical protein [Bacilli bacterium]MCH4278082.1 hypothetical protein [Bacilli bacterium]
MVKNQTNEKQLIVVAGVTGSGKSTFSSAFKNSFLRSLPLLSLDKGLASDSSFYVETNLSNASQFSYFEKAKDLGYKITVYYLFTGKQLSIARARLREAAGGEHFEEGLFKKSYEASYKGLTSVFSVADVIFLLRNQKSLDFVTAFQPSNGDIDTFSKMVKRLKSEVDSIS